MPKSARRTPIVEARLPAAPRRRVGVVALLVLGLGLWVAVGGWRHVTFRAVAGSVLVTMLATRPTAERWVEALRLPSPRRRFLTTLAVFAGAAVYLFALTVLEHQEHYPRFHDESMHLLQARMLAGGRLWMPAHALPQFFETFFVLVKPVYGAMQFPGASLFYVPGIWLGVQPWVTSLLIAAATMAVTYRVVAQLIDGAAGLIAAVWLVGIEDFRYYGLMVLSYPVALLLGLALVWAWLRWRERKSVMRCAVVGVLAGWAAVNRPADAVCFALPVFAAMSLDLWAEGRGRSIRGIATMAITLAVAVAPFFALQLAFDKGATGSWLKTPHALYVEQFNPRLTYGLGGKGEDARLASGLPEKRDYYELFVLPQARDYTPGTAVGQWLGVRLPTMLNASLPTLLLVPLLPCGLLALTTRARRVLVGAAVVFVAVYAFTPIFPGTYAMAVVGSLVLLALLGGEMVVGAWKLRRAPVAALLACLGASALPWPVAPVREQFSMPTLAAVHELLPLIPGRAVVFFKYASGDNVHEDPVYNLDVAEIDACRVVRAQDLGALENVKLYDYYRARQPDRAFYRFDRATGVLAPIDPQSEYAAATGRR